MTTLAQYVTEQISVVCPVLGVSIGRPNDKTTWRIDFDIAATPAQRVSAQGVIDGLDLAAANAAIAVQNDPNDFQNCSKFFRAKCISDLAFRLGVAPGALTLAQIQAERTRIKNIADALP